jgi:hypothetical protein
LEKENYENVLCVIHVTSSILHLSGLQISFSTPETPSIRVK